MRRVQVHFIPMAGMALLAFSVAAAGCKRKEQPSDFKYEPPPRTAATLASYVDLCEGRGAFSGAKKYEKQKSGGAPSKVAVFRKYADDKEPVYRLDQRDTLGAVAAKEQETDQVELVTCVELKRKGTPLYCHYYGAEVEVYDMTHSVRILEASTGKVLKEETFDLDGRTEPCEGSVTGNFYKGAEYGPKLLSMLLPFEPEGLELPKVDMRDLDSVCSGSPIPQTAPYKADAPGKRGVHLVYFATEAQSNTRRDAPDGLFPGAEPEADPTKYQLVACATGKPQKKKANCEFISGEVLEIYDGEVEVAVYESATAKLVEKKTFKATSAICPSTHKFFGKNDKRMMKVEPAFAAYMKKLEGA